MLGFHWIADLHRCDRATLTRELVREALIEVPQLLGLSALGPPELSEHADMNDSSIAGVVLLRESHASCHAFPASGVVHLDVFCCRNVDFDPAARYAVAHFRAAAHESRVLERGYTGSGRSLGGVVRRFR